MIKVENIEVFNFEGAVRGMRNPMNSWDRSDSGYGCGLILECNDCPLERCPSNSDYCVGKNDLALMQKLYQGGPVHAKYLRQIMVSMDITAPLYWWKEFDTYKVGTTANSCSTMHKIHSKEFVEDDFSSEHMFANSHGVLLATIDALNLYRAKYIELKGTDKDDAKRYWWQMIQLLPSSYNQKRTVTMNYQNVMNMLDWRTNHKLDEWVLFCEELRKLPYIKAIRGEK